MIRPTGINILVELLPRQEQSGLLIPELSKRWQEENLYARIVALGEYVSELEVGDTVIIEGHAGKWVDPGTAGDMTKTYRFITKSEIVVVIEPQETNQQEAVA